LGKVLRLLQDLSKLPSPGPAPAFSHVQVCSALLVIGDDAPIGRIELSRKLSLGEGAIRTVIKHLTQAGLVATAKDGCVLTIHGLSLYDQLRRKLSKVLLMDAGRLSLDKVNAVILIKSAGRRVRRGIEQRDAAVRAGATGACTLVFRVGEYVMPTAERDWKLSSRDSLVRTLGESFHPRNYDVVIIVSASSKPVAEYGAMAAALTLLE
jgi:predicted transcriptional regulator